jgi:hypothetical protein
LTVGAWLCAVASAARFGDPGGPPIVFSAGFTSDMVLESSRPTVYGLVAGPLVSGAKVEVSLIHPHAFHVHQPTDHNRAVRRAG